MIAAPKGDRVAWVSNTLGRRNIWGAEAPDWNAKQITHYGAVDGQEITDLDLSSECALIAYVRGGDKNLEGELPDPASDPAGIDQSVWTVGWAGAAPHKIDVGNHPHISPHSTAVSGFVAYEKDGKVWVASIGGKPTEVYMRGENSGVEWAPDGKKFAFTTNRATHSLIAIYDTSKKEISYVTPTTDSDSTPRWSLDGKYIAFMRSGGFGGFGRGGGGGGAGRGGRGGRGGAGGGPAISLYNVETNEGNARLSNQWRHR